MMPFLIVVARAVEPAEQMWEAAIRRLGADPAALQMSRGVH